jgi:hypothetical protein
MLIVSQTFVEILYVFNISINFLAMCSPEWMPSNLLKSNITNIIEISRDILKNSCHKINFN